MYAISFSDLAKKQLKKLEIEIQERIITTIERCRIRPHYFAKKIVGTSCFALRTGNYRIIIKIYNKEIKILVVKIGHRKKIYK